jgi:signal transduction histidine kinase
MVILFLISQFLISNAQSPVFISTDQKQTLNLWPYCQILEDKHNAYQINDLLNDSIHHVFKEAKGIPSTFGFTTSAYWIKFKTKSAKADGPVFLTIERVSLWEAELFSIDAVGRIKQEHLGVNVPYQSKTFVSKFAICELANQGTHTYFLKVRAITSLFVPIYLDSIQSLSEKLTKVDLFNGVYLGIFFTLILYNLFAFLIRKQTIYGWYLFYVLTLFIYQGLFNTGLGFEYLWPNWPDINQHYVVASSLFGISMIAFSYNFLEVKENLNGFHLPLYLLGSCFGLLALTSLMGYSFQSSKYFFWVLMPTFIYLTIIGTVSLYRGNSNARLYLAGWGVLVIFYFLFTLWLNGFIGESGIGHRALFLGSFFEMIFWFSAVSDKVSLSRKAMEKEKSALRREVGRDFHDELGNRAARLINYVGLLRIRGNIAPEIYETISTHSQNILDGAKDFVWSLDPVNDNLNRVILHLKDFGEQLLSEKGISFRFYGHIDPIISLSSGHSRQINLIFKEAITNAFKHSQASEVEMSVEVQNKKARIILKDNGKGAPEEILQNSTRGIGNIRSRSRKINSTIEITSGTEGTILILTIPLLL